MKSMKTLHVLLASLLLLASVGPAAAGKHGPGKPGPGKPHPVKCRNDKACKGDICVRQSPKKKDGICCHPRSCGELGAQCGSLDNGCGALAECGTCSPGSDCTDNQCLADTTTSTTTTTDTTTSTTIDNPCIPNPCTSCGIFSFFWCVAYEDGQQQCVFNEGSGGSCSSDANCDVAGGDRCAYDTLVGYKRCIQVTGVCPSE